jgi:DnaJ-class molecular chaperone
MKKWHPDKHPDNSEEANQMSMKINHAYETIMNYVGHYEYRFDEEFLKDATISPQEWWEKRFGGR